MMEIKILFRSETLGIFLINRLIGLSALVEGIVE